MVFCRNLKLCSPIDLMNLRRIYLFAIERYGKIVKTIPIKLITQLQLFFMHIYSTLDFMIDYSKFCSSLNRLSSDYYHIYISSFKNTLLQRRNNSSANLFYETFLENLDKIYETELKSKRFTQLLGNYMDSLIDFRQSCKSLGVPMDEIDQFLYETKKRIFNFSSAKDIENNSSSTPSEIIYFKKKVEVIHYINNNPSAIPVILVYAQINRFNIMDLMPKKSVVRNLIENGFDVYVIHWGYSGKEDDPTTINDYINYLDESVEIIKKKTSQRQISIIGYCWGGILSIIYSSIFREKINKLVVIATPIDFDKDQSFLSLWAKDIDTNKLIDEFGHMDPMLLDIGFIMRNPSRNFDKYFKMISRLSDKLFLENFFSVERWLHNTPPIPGEYFKKIINDGYKNNLLIKNQMVVLDKKIDLKKIDMPVLTVVAEKDDLVSPQSTLELHKFISSKQQQSLSYEGGHVGLCISSHAQKTLWPKISEWLKTSIEAFNSNQKIKDTKLIAA